jgi:hypothetical protein
MPHDLTASPKAFGAGSHTCESKIPKASEMSEWR